MNWGQRSLEEQIGDWCRNFNGIQNEVCRAGVCYKSLPGSDNKKPCFKSDGCADRCLHASYLSEEEIAAKAVELRTATMRYMDKLHAGKCPVCDAEVQEERQVGRCVYAEPCGHRMYQGKSREKRHE